MDRELLHLLETDWGLTGELTQLEGEVDLNFILTGPVGKFCIKLHSQETELTRLEYQNKILDALNSQEMDFLLPRVWHPKNGEQFIYLESSGIRYVVRVLSWIDGKLWSSLNNIPSPLMYELGFADGTLTRQCSNLQVEGGSGDPRWIPSEVEWIGQHLELFKGEERKVVEYFLNQFAIVFPENKADLRESVLYLDANDNNIIVEKVDNTLRIKGFIDFGDCNKSYTINELAVNLAYACMKVRDPLSIARIVVSGFHAGYSLQEAELEVLYVLTAARLLESVTFSALRKGESKQNKYLLVSEKQAWDLLKKWREVPPGKALAAFRFECGFEPVSGSIELEEILSRTPVQPLLGIEYLNAKGYPLDLSIGSHELGNNSEFAKPEFFQRRFRQLLQDSGSTYAIGGYLEVRPVYVDDRFTEFGNQGKQWRAVHLGHDIWVPVESPIYAPIDGVVVVSVDNKGAGNYGPTLLIKHELEGTTFYTLYGHLSRETLSMTKVGDVIAAGTQIATVGKTEVNGGWTPHLHFQLVKNLWDESGDFPGVAYHHELQIMASACPNPGHITGYFELPSANPEDLALRRNESIGPSLSVSYNSPLAILRGFGQYLYGHTGRRYLDTVNNVAHVGHEHPRVVNILSKQSAVLNTNTRYLHPAMVDFSEKLAAKFPDPLAVCYFVNSGSEANELALRIARTVTGKGKMMALEMGYHGNTAACIDVSSYKFNRKGGNGIPDSTLILSAPDTFRKPDYMTDFPNELERLLENVEVAGFIGEPILSCAGQIVPPAGFFKKIYAEIRANGGLCIADEVQVGFGRVGQTFWGFELDGVVPDIVTMGKPMGNGHPLGAVITTPEIAQAFANGMEYFNTFGGNPVSCSVGSEVLAIIEDEGLQEHALAMGDYLMNGLTTLSNQYPIIADIRGSGLFLGFELMHKQVPATFQASYLANRMRDRGVLMSTDGPDENVLKIKPPLCIQKENIDYLLDQLDEVLIEDLMNE